MKITLELSKSSIKKALRGVRNYENTLRLKSQLLIERLLEVGISVAYQHTGKYEGYVEFTKEIDIGDKQVVGVLIGRDLKPFISEWKFKGGKRSVEVSGLLMLEFGSGWLADVRWDVPGVGQGTFPGQTHATDPDGWWWEDLDGHKHHSIGEVPQYPMYNADMRMIEQIDAIAKEVFSL